MKVLLSEFDLSHVKVSDPRYLVTAMDNCGSFPLGFREDNIGKIFTRRNYCDSFKIILIGHLGCG